MELKTISENGTTYTGTEIKVKNTRYHVTVVKGNHNYIVIKQINSRSRWHLGKTFKSFDEAVRNYKNASMKVELLKLETLILR
jgi:hypothetical protein